jgi:hypothetical protein
MDAADTYMESEEIQRRFIDLAEKLDKLETLTRETRDSVIRLEVKTSNLREPGECEHCRIHASRVEQMSVVVDGMRAKFWVAYGIGLAAIAVGQYIITKIIKP